MFNLNFHRRFTTIRGKTNKKIKIRKSDILCQVFYLIIKINRRTLGFNQKKSAHLKILSQYHVMLRPTPRKT